MVYSEQTYGGEEGDPTMGQKYVELERLRRLPSVFVGPDGRVMNPGAPPAYLSPIKKGKSSKQGASSSSQAYSCPRSTCFRTFADWTGVRRHLIRCGCLLFQLSNVIFCISVFVLHLDHKFSLEDAQAQRKKVFMQAEKDRYCPSKRLMQVREKHARLFLLRLLNYGF